MVFWLSGIAAKGQELYLRSYTPAPYIGQNKITCSFEDASGLMHLGTKGAVYRFDGVYYQAIPLPDSLQTESVNSIFVTGDILYAGLSNGILLQMAYLQSPDFAVLCSIGAPVTDVITDAAGRCWLSSYGRGIMVIGTDGTVMPVEPPENEAGLYVYDLESDYSGNVWAGTDAGLFRYRMNGERITTMSIDDPKLPDQIIKALELDEHNRLWIGFQEGGVCHYLVDEEQYDCSGTASQSLPDITSLCYQAGELWIGLAFGGLYSMSPQNGRLTRYENQAIPRRIIALGQSLLGGLWIIGSEEILYSPGRQILFYGKQTGNDNDKNDIQALIQDNKSFVWYATEQGLFRFHPEHPETLQAAEWFNPTAQGKTYFTCLYEDKQGYLWAGTFDRGVMRMSPDRSTVQFFDESNGLTNNNVLRIDGYDNNLWFATLGGVSAAKTETGGKVVFADAGLHPDFNQAYYYTVFVDSKRRIWLGTDGNGPQLIENGQHLAGLFPELNDKVVYSITEDQEGRIWMAVPDDGLYCLIEDSLRRIGVENGLVSAQITALSPTKSNYLMVSGYEGIDLVNIYTFAVMGHYRSYGINDLKPDLNALFCNEAGDCYAGSQRGIIRLSNVGELANRKPIMHLSEHNVNLSPVNASVGGKFKNSENHHVMRYTAIWYPAPEDVFYRLRMQGLDTSWQLTRDHEAVYPSLNPGNYYWEAEASLNRNFIQSDGIGVAFSIEKPLWQQWWMWLLVLIAVALLVYWMFRIRIEKLRLVELQKQKQAEFDYLLLRNQVNPHFLFNSFGTLISVIENDKQQAVAYVEKLSDYFRNLLQYRDQQLISLTEELRLLETYIFLQQQRYGANLNIQVDIHQNYMISLIPPMSLQMLAENAVKHNRITKTSPLLISISVSDGSLKISNNIQLRQSPEKSTGLGLQNITDRYRLIIGREVMVQNTGNEFIVRLPIIFSHDNKSTDR